MRFRPSKPDKWGAPPGSLATVQNPAYIEGYLQVVWDKGTHNQADGSYFGKQFALAPVPLP